MRCAGPDGEIRNCKTGTLLCSNCQKHQLDETISLKEQVFEIAHLNSEFLALKTELAEVKEQNKRYEKKLTELVTYSIFHTKTLRPRKRSGSL